MWSFTNRTFYSVLWTPQTYLCKPFKQIQKISNKYNINNNGKCANRYKWSGKSYSNNTQNYQRVLTLTNTGLLESPEHTTTHLSNLTSFFSRWQDRPCSSTVWKVSETKIVSPRLTTKINTALTSSTNTFLYLEQNLFWITYFYSLTFVNVYFCCFL